MSYPTKSFTRWILYVPTENGYIIKFFKTKADRDKFAEENKV